MEQVDRKEDLNADNTSSVLNTVLNTINNEFEHKCLEEAVRLLNAHSIRQSTDNRFPDHKYSIPGLPRSMFLVQHVWAIWFIVRRWVSDADMPGTLVVDEMDLGKTFTSVAAAMPCTLVTEKVVMGLPLSIFLGNTLEESVNVVQNAFPGIIGDEREWYPLWKQNSVRSCLSEIQSTTLQGHPVFTLAFEPILVLTIPGVAETFKSVINEMAYGTDFKLINSVQVENATLPHEGLNSSIDEPHN